MLLRRWQVLVSGLLLLVGSACVSPDLEKTRSALATCEAARTTADSELVSCREQTARDIQLIAKNLESVLIESSPVAAELSLSPPAEVPMSAPVEIEAATVARVQQLSLAVSARFAELQKELTLQLEESRREARGEQRATQAELARLREATSGLGSQTTEAQSLRDELDALRRAQEEDLKSVQATATELANAVRTFDAARINCPRCGRGFSDRFARELLTLHGQLLRQLDELKSSEELEVSDR